jgi:hypothetical protein
MEWSIADVINSVVKERTAKNAKASSSGASSRPLKKNYPDPPLPSAAAAAANAAQPTHSSIRKTLERVWGAYNEWILEQMLKRKGAASPLCVLSWEFYSKSTKADDDEAYQMRCRPAFVLDEGFKRNFSISKLKIAKSAFPPTLSASEAINFHKLALRYSSDLTKDMIFSGFRDIMRKIGELLQNGKKLKIEFSVGMLVSSRERKIAFDFDNEALKVSKAKYTKKQGLVKTRQKHTAEILSEAELKCTLDLMHSDSTLLASFICAFISTTKKQTKLQLETDTSFFISFLFFVLLLFTA